MRPRPLSSRVRMRCLARWGVRLGDELLATQQYDRRRKSATVRATFVNGHVEGVTLSLVADDDAEAIDLAPSRVGGVVL
jgi:hypothetical protein